MTENQRQSIRECAHRLRSRLTYVMLASHTLRLDLREVLSQTQDEEFCRIAEALEATRTDLNILLRLFDGRPRGSGAPPADELPTIGAG